MRASGRVTVLAPRAGATAPLLGATVYPVLPGSDVPWPGPLYAYEDAVSPLTFPAPVDAAGGLTVWSDGALSVEAALRGAGLRRPPGAPGPDLPGRPAGPAPAPALTDRSAWWGQPPGRRTTPARTARRPCSAPPPGAACPCPGRACGPTSRARGSRGRTPSTAAPGPPRPWCSRWRRTPAASWRCGRTPRPASNCATRRRGTPPRAPCWTSSRPRPPSRGRSVPRGRRASRATRATPVRRGQPGRRDPQARTGRKARRDPQAPPRPSPARRGQPERRVDPGPHRTGWPHRGRLDRARPGGTRRIDGTRRPAG